MLSVIENSVKFVLKHRYLRMGINYIVISLVFFFFVVAFMIFYKTGVIYYNPTILLHKKTYLWLWENYKTIFIFAVFIEQFMLWLFLFYNKAKTNKSSFQQEEVEKVPLENFVHLWLSEEEMEDLYKKTPQKEKQLRMIRDPESLEVWINTVNDLFIDEIKLFIYEVIRPNFELFSEKELQMLVMFLSFLQENKECPSVTSIYHSDSNKAYKEDMITLNISAYEALSKYVPLLTHSLNVAKNAVKIIESEKISVSKKKKIIPQSILASLAHDLGKIERYNSQVTTNKDYVKRVKELPHQEISSMIVNEIGYIGIKMDDEYIKEIARVVKMHHTPINKDDLLLYILIQADWATRNKEKLYCIEQIKNEAKKKNEQEAKEVIEKNTETTQQESIETKTIHIAEFENRSSSEVLGLKNKDSYIAMLNLTRETRKNTIKEFAIFFKDIPLKYIHNDSLLVFLKEKGMADVETILYKLQNALKDKHTIAYLSLKGIDNAYKAINVLQKALFSNNGEIINAEDFIEAEKDTLDKKEENIVIPSDFQDKIKNAKESLTTIGPSKKSDIKESAFECDKFAEAIFSQIREKVGEPFSGSSSFCAVPYKTRSRILVSSQFFISLIEEVSKCSRGEAIKRANYFVKYYGSKDSNPRYIYDINVTKGYYTSIYFLVENGKKFEYICVPFDRKALNIDNAKMDYYTKKETLKNIKIEQFMQF